MRKIIFGIRRSVLARAQLDEFIAYLVEKGVTMEYEVKTITTQGDKNRKTPVEELGQGIFVKELERALLAGEIDCAVHSLKDVPVDVANGTDLVCFPPRSDERDCLVCHDGVAQDDLRGKRIAVSSPRRVAFMREVVKDGQYLPVRGNVDTRLKKVERGEYDAMVLAACGLQRIGQSNRIAKYLDSDSFVPAAGQGALCAQIRADDPELNSVLGEVLSVETKVCVRAEREVLKKLDIGCRTAFGVYARFKKDEFMITAKAHVSGKENPYWHCKLKGSRAEHKSVTEDLIGRMRVFMEKVDISNCSGHDEKE